MDWEIGAGAGWLEGEPGVELGRLESGGAARLPLRDALLQIELRGSAPDREALELGLWEGAAKAGVSALMARARGRSRALEGLEAARGAGREDVEAVRLGEGGFGFLSFGLERSDPERMALALCEFCGDAPGRMELLMALLPAAKEMAAERGELGWAGIGKALRRGEEAWARSREEEAKLRWALGRGGIQEESLGEALGAELKEPLAALARAVIAGGDRLREGEGRVDLEDVARGAGMLWVEAPGWRRGGPEEALWRLVSSWLQASRERAIWSAALDRVEGASGSLERPGMGLWILAGASAADLTGVLRWGRAAGVAVAFSEDEGRGGAVRGSGWAGVRLVGGSSPREALEIARHAGLEGRELEKAERIAREISPGEALALRLARGGGAERVLLSRRG